MVQEAITWFRNAHQQAAWIYTAVFRRMARISKFGIIIWVKLSVGALLNNCSKLTSEMPYILEVRYFVRESKGWWADDYI